ncbi:MAG: ADP-ribosylglycohydrolase family protein [Halorientalis sp.]
MVTHDCGEGVLLGLACGDALGEPVEGWSADRIAAEHGTLTALVGGRVPPGGLTDDTEQALRLARSLVECETFDPDDASRRFVEWFEGDPVGIGGLTRRVLGRIADGDDWERASRESWKNSREGRNAGNGSVMRCAPIAVAYAHDRDELAAASRTSSKLTHYDPRCVYGCELLDRTIAGYLRDDPRPLADARSALPEAAPEELISAIEPVPDGIDPEALSPTGYVVDTLQAATYHALAADNAESAIVNAVNGGGDTDTIGAVAGAIAGARFGASDLPDRWVRELDRAEELRRLGRELAALDPGSSSNGGR